MTNPALVFDRSLLRRRRERAAARIGDHDFLLEDVAERLVERLQLVKRSFPVLLDLGGHGALARALGRAGLGAQVFSSDLAFGMAARAPAGLVADEEFLPFAERSLDAVVSNLALHWVNDLPGALVQIRRALKEDGLFLAAVLGGETLRELRDALMAAELAVTDGASPRVSPFIDLRDMGALLQRAGFALPVVDSDAITVQYSDPLRLMRDLRGMGAANATLNRLKKPTRRAVLMEAARLYREKYAAADGTVPATFQVVYAIGWSPHASQQKPLKPGSAQAKLAEALNTAEIPTDDKARP